MQVRLQALCVTYDVGWPEYVTVRNANYSWKVSVHRNMGARGTDSHRYMQSANGHVISVPPREISFVLWKGFSGAGLLSKHLARNENECTYVIGAWVPLLHFAFLRVIAFIRRLPHVKSEAEWLSNMANMRLVAVELSARSGK